MYKTITTESEARKQPEPTDPAQLKAYYDKIVKEKKTFGYVDLKFKTSDKSDLEIEIKSGSNNQEFDVGAAIKQKFIPFGAP